MRNEGPGGTIGVVPVLVAVIRAFCPGWIRIENKENPMTAQRSLLDDGGFDVIGRRGNSAEKAEGGARRSASRLKRAAAAALTLMAILVCGWQFGMFGSASQKGPAGPISPSADDVERTAKQQKYNEDMIKSGKAKQGDS